MWKRSRHRDANLHMRGGVLYSHCCVCPSRPHWHQQSRDHSCTLEPDPSASWQSDWVSRLLDAGTLQRLPQRNRNPNSRLDDDSHTRGAADIKCRRQHWMAMVCSSFKIQIRVGPYLTFFSIERELIKYPMTSSHGAQSPFQKLSHTV